jgi:NADH-quinone oxidoreductase subunit E
MTESSETLILDPAVVTAIDHWLTKFPADRRQSALLAALHVAQDHYQGYLTVPVMDAVADYLDVPRVAAYEAATFYSMYTCEPAGRHKIDVCTNISCLLRGSNEVVQHLENRLDVKLGGVTTDGRFRLRSVECLGACINAPMMQVDKDYHENLTSDKIDEILTHYE